MKQAKTRRQSGAAVLDQGEVRSRLEALRREASLRDLGGAIGVTHYTIRQFLEGKAVRPSTLRRIASWLDRRHDDDGLTLRDVLRRVLGKLPASRAKEVQADVIAAISEALREDGIDIPDSLQ